MKQVLNKLVKRKTNVTGNYGKRSYNIEINEEKTNEIFKGFKTIMTGIRIRK